jgi:hypothetical protein
MCTISIIIIITFKDAAVKPNLPRSPQSPPVGDQQRPVVPVPHNVY